jgi:hypothetical protein
MGSIRLLMQLVSDAHFREQSGRGVSLTIDINFVSRPRICGSISPFLPMSIWGCFAGSSCFCGRAPQLWPRPLLFEFPRSREIRHTHTHKVTSSSTTQHTTNQEMKFQTVWCIPAVDRSQAYALDLMATGTG